MRHILAVVMLAIGLIAPEEGRAEWLQASSPHFVVYAEDSEHDLRVFSERLERYHAAMALLTNTQAPDPSPSNRVTVYAVKNETEVRKLYGGGKNSYLGGFYLPRAGGSLAIVPNIQGTGDMPQWSMIVLLHEYAHHFLIGSSSIAMPRWVSEGGAEFFASASFEKDGSIWVGRPANHRAGELHFARDVRAIDLIDAESYEKRAGGGYDAFYGKSWLLYHYLTFDKERSGQLGRYLRLIQGGKPSKAAGLEAFGDLGKLESDLDRYLAKSRMTAFHLPPDMLKMGKVETRRPTAGETVMMPVIIRSKRGVDDKQAAALLIEARAVAARFPEDAAVSAALAEAEYDADHDKEAIAAADTAIRIDPGQTNAYVQKGLALFRMAEGGSDPAAFTRARAAFVALNRKEPDHPLPLIYFYRSFVEQGRTPPDIAVQGLERASELAPFDFGLRMNLARQMLRDGRQPLARQMLAPVAYNPHGGSFALAAQKMIDRIDHDPKWNGEGADAMGGEQEAATGGTGDR
jgi:tetratricopeptide (TPR) repeat protein